MGSGSPCDPQPLAVGTAVTHSIGAGVGGRGSPSAGHGVTDSGIPGMPRGITIVRLVAEGELACGKVCSAFSCRSPFATEVECGKVCSAFPFCYRVCFAFSSGCGSCGAVSTLSLDGDDMRLSSSEDGSSLIQHFRNMMS